MKWLRSYIYFKLVLLLANNIVGRLFTQDTNIIKNCVFIRWSNCWHKSDFLLFFWTLLWTSILFSNGTNRTTTIFNKYQIWRKNYVPLLTFGMQFMDCLWICWISYGGFIEVYCCPSSILKVQLTDKQGGYFAASLITWIM